LYFATFMCLTLLGQSGAWAHARLVTTLPLSHSVIKIWPSKVTITFDEPVLRIGNAVVDWVQVSDAIGQRVDAGQSRVQGAVVSVGLKEKVKTGRYAVQYRVVSDDGHPVLGKYFFTYRPKG